MDLSVHSIVASCSHHYINAKHRITGHFLVRSNTGKDTRCDFAFNYYDGRFQEAEVYLEHLRNIRSKKWDASYKNVIEHLIVTLLDMPIMKQIQVKDASIYTPSIQIKEKTMIKDNKRLFHILLENDSTVYKMLVDKVNGSWVYIINDFFDKTYPSDIRSQMFQAIQNTKPYNLLFLFQ